MIEGTAFLRGCAESAGGVDALGEKCRGFGLPELGELSAARRNPDG